jgi:hypothetical protein
MLSISEWGITLAVATAWASVLEPAHASLATQEEAAAVTDPFRHTGAAAAFCRAITFTFSFDFQIMNQRRRLEPQRNIGID